LVWGWKARAHKLQSFPFAWNIWGIPKQKAFYFGRYSEDDSGATPWWESEKGICDRPSCTVQGLVICFGQYPPALLSTRWLTMQWFALINGIGHLQDCLSFADSKTFDDCRSWPSRRRFLPAQCSPTQHVVFTQGCKKSGVYYFLFFFYRFMISQFSRNLLFAASWVLN